MRCRVGLILCPLWLLLSVNDGRGAVSLGPAPAARVVATAPRGQIGETTELQVTFDRPMAALGATEVRGFAIVTAPALKGRLRWAAPELLAFSPEKLAPATRYTARLEWHGDGPSPIAERASVAWTFETPGPELEGLHPHSDLRRHQAIIVTLTQAVPVASAREHLEVSAKGDRGGVTGVHDCRPDELTGRCAFAPSRVLPVRVEAATMADVRAAFPRWSLPTANDVRPREGATRFLAVRPEQRWPILNELTVKLEAGLTGRLGPVPSRGGERTIGSGSDGLYVERALCPASGCSLGERLEIRLSDDITPAQAARIRIAPKPDSLLVHLRRWAKRSAGREVAIWGRFVAGETYKVTLPPDLRDVHGRTLGETTGGRAVTLTYSFPKQPKLEVFPDDGVLAVPTPAHAGLQSRFVRAVEIRAVALSNIAAATVIVNRGHRPPLPAVAPTEIRPLSIVGPHGWAEEVLDLDRLTGGRRGMVGLEVRPISAEGELPAAELRYLQRTDVAPLAWVSGSRMALLALRHSDLRPIAGATVSEIGQGQKAGHVLGLTDAAGRLDAELVPQLVSPVLAVEDRAGDARYVPLMEYGRPSEDVRLHATVERDLLRPGDRVHVAGWAVLESPDAPTGWRWLPAGTPAELELRDGAGKLVDHATCRLDALGRLWGELNLSARPALGRGAISIRVREGRMVLPLRIEDVRPPSLDVRVTVPPAVVLGQPLPLDVEVKQLSGEPAAVSGISFTTRCERVRAPELKLEPSSGSWELGTPTRSGSRMKQWLRSGPFEDGRWRELTSSATLAAPRQPSQCRIDATATGFGRDRVGETTSTFVHPAPAYLALSAPDVPAGQRFSVNVRAVDLAGGRTDAGPATVTLARIGAKGARTLVDSCRAHPDVAKDATCWFPGQPEGTYRLYGHGRSGVVHAVESDIFVFRTWHGASSIEPRPDARLALTLDPARKEVAPGDRVRAVITSPTDAGGLLIVERSGLRERHGFTVREGRTELELVAKESWFPAVRIRVAAPVRRRGEGTRIEQDGHDLTVNGASRTLAVSISAPDVVRPRDRVPLRFRVVDSQHRPLEAHLTVWAVDVAYLRLTEFSVKEPEKVLRPSDRHGYAMLVDPFASLLSPFRPVGRDPSLHTREEVLGILIGEEIGEAYGVGGLGLVGTGSGGGGTGDAEVRRRERMEPVPLFVGDVATAADGTATLVLAMPDDLTSFRITALATAPMPDGNPIRLGKAELEIASRQPLVLRAVMPRLLRPGDSSEVGALVRNLSGHDGVLEVQAAFRSLPGTATPPAAIVSEPTRSLLLRAGHETRVPFRVEGRAAGTTELELTAVLRPGAEATGVPVETDALRSPLSVEAEPASIDRAAAYLTLPAPGRSSLQIRVPERLLPGGAVSVEASASLLAEALDAAEYLVDYPHGCAEQTSGAILGLMASRQLRTLGLRAPEVTQARLQARLARLASMQLDSGGFTYWPGARQVNPQVSVYATWVLAHAREAGVAVPDDVTSRASRYVAGRVTELLRQGHADAELAFAVAALAAAGQPLPGPAIDALLSRGDGIDTEALANLILALHRAAATDPRLPPLLDLLCGRMLQTPGAARIPDSPEGAETDPFASPARTHALATLAMLRARPGHPLGVKLLRGLFDRRKDGRWRNTQENAFALLAAAEQAAHEAARGPSSLHATLAGRTVLDGELRAASSTPLRVTVPSERLPEGAGEIALGMDLRHGGPVHVRAATSWIVADPQPRSEGIELERLMAATAAEDGWIRCTLVVRVRVPLRFVAVTVPVPAGLEGVLDLAGMAGHATERVPWASHQELWRDRISVYADSLQPGVYRAVLSLRAVTPGDYVLPMATAEAMYEPEIQARTARGRVRVEARAR